MPTITTKGGTSIFYKDWGSGQPIVFSHGWPLSADDWDAQLLFFMHRGDRVIAHDRRGHGRSTQTAGGHDMDHYADDLAALTEHLDLKGAIHVGHSTGGGEVARYLGRHGEGRVAKAALVCAVTPLMVKTPANPLGLAKEVFDGLQAQVAANRSQFYRDLPAMSPPSPRRRRDRQRSHRLASDAARERLHSDASSDVLGSSVRSLRTRSRTRRSCIIDRVPRRGAATWLRPP
jgi:pimeloyl-ACP methyl ester carboxylesterase